MKIKVLLVEDNRELLEAHSTILEILGYDFVASRSGEEAWGVYDGRDFDLVISDISMAKGDGLWLLQKVRGMSSEQSEVPFFLSSGYTEWSEEELIKRGATGFLKKPYDLVSFLDANFPNP